MALKQLLYSFLIGLQGCTLVTDFDREYPTWDTGVDARVMDASTEPGRDLGVQRPDIGARVDAMISPDFGVDSTTVTDSYVHDSRVLDAEPDVQLEDAATPPDARADSRLSDAQTDVFEPNRCYENNFENPESIDDFVFDRPANWSINAEGYLEQRDGQDGTNVAYLQGQVFDNFDYTLNIQMPLGQGRDQHVGAIFGYNAQTGEGYILKVGNAAGNEADVILETLEGEILTQERIAQDLNRWQFQPIDLRLQKRENLLEVYVNDEFVFSHDADLEQGALGVYSQDSRLRVYRVDVCEF